MNRSIALVAVVVVFTALSTSVWAERLPRIGYLALESIRDEPSRDRQAFLDGLAEFGHLESKSVEIIYRSGEGEVVFLPAMCEDLLQQKVDVLVTVGEQPTLACLRQTETVPIVFLAMSNPVGSGVTESLGRPARNATGVNYTLSGLAGKRVELLRLAIRHARRVAFIWDPLSSQSRIDAEGATAAAERFGIHPISVPVATQAELNGSFEPMTREQPDAIYVSFAAGLIARNRTAIVEFALRNKLAVVSAWSLMTEAGGLLSYSPDVPAMFRRGAYYVDRILGGARPGELPIEQPSTIELVINLRTARQLGLTLTSELILRADRIIE